MVAQGTRLEFEARVTGAKPVLAKAPAQQYGQGSNGRLELTLTLDQPVPPREPHKPTPEYSYNQGGKMIPRPGDIQRKKNETDEDYDGRDAVVRRVADQTGWDRAKARFDRDLANYTTELRVYQAAQEGYRERVLAYAGLVGITVVFGATPVKVVITPLRQDVLPGFSASLLSEPEPETPAETEEKPSAGTYHFLLPDDMCRCGDTSFNHADEGAVGAGPCEVTRDAKPCGCERFEPAAAS